MAERFDVVVVGARCAGSPLAALLARRGIRVALVERATFPRDALSTHVFQADALAFLDRLGVIEQVRATGAPFVDRVDFRADVLRATISWPLRPGDVGGCASVRRLTLDPILAQAAAEAGADVRMATEATGLVTGDGRVAGVRVSHNGREAELRTRLVVGADGRGSTVARLCGARKYNVTPGERFAYWTFFEGADLGAEPTLVFHRWGDRWVLGCPADSGLYGVACAPPLERLAAWRDDLEGSFAQDARSCEPVARAISSARRVGKFFGMLRWTGYFREASGPGWVLAGDAGHFKDPTLGVGIGDAFQQAETLAPAIAEGLGGTDVGLDRAMARWGGWRDDEAAERYWLATDLGQASTLPVVGVELVRRLEGEGRLGLFLDVISRRAQPSEFRSVPRVLGAAGRLLGPRGGDRRAVIREVATLAVQDARRRWLDRHPAYAADDE